MGPYERQDVPAYVGLRTPMPALADEVNVFDVGGGTPGGEIALVYGLRAGSTPVPGCPGVSVGILRPAVAEVVRGNRVGFARFEQAVPKEAEGRVVLMQAVDVEGCAVSGVEAVEFE